MTTYRGNEIPKPDPLDEDLKLVGQRLGGMENVEEELNLPPSAEPDYMPKPGQKHYLENQQMAKKPFVPIGPGGNLLVPNNNREKVDKIIDYLYSPMNKGSFSDPRGPGDTLHQRDEPDDTGSYASGGRVQKFGSSTHVSCKSKG
jgi:hypothetical protein